MLKKRSRPVTSSSKQAMAGEHSNLYLPPEKTAKSNSFFFNSPRFLKNFFAFSSEPDSIMSPTSILDTKPFSAIANTFWADKKIPPPPPTPTPKTPQENKHSWNQPNNSKGIGIALADVEENSEPNIDSSKQAQKRKLVVFGSQLRIQVPQSSVFPSFSPESAASPGEFGIKTLKTSLRVREETPDVIENESISMIDIEQSEDYTCVISHGPNPKTTHIFGNCIVESGSRVNGSSSNRNGYLSPCRNPVPSPENFLSFCHHCKKHLGQGKDIYMYRGEKAFCSEECRCQEMLFDRLES